MSPLIHNPKHASIKNACAKVTIVALEFPEAWNGLRKIRISQSELNNCAQNENDKDYTGHDLQQAILFAFQNKFKECAIFFASSPSNCSASTENTSFCTPQREINHNPALVVEAYDDSSHQFIPLSGEKNGLRFGSKIRACITKSCNGNDDNTSPNDKEELLTITGRFFPYDPSGVIPFANTELEVKEVPNNKVDGTGLNIWDGALYLARYLELQPEIVRFKGILELGSGCGLVGIASAALGAREVVLTDLSYTLPIMRENVARNIETITTAGCERIECMACDWLQPPPPTGYGFSLPSNVDLEVILVADCV